MYNELRKKVNLLLEDTDVLDQTSEKNEEKCPECGNASDDCKCQTTQEGFLGPKQVRSSKYHNTGVKDENDGYGEAENYTKVAKQILKRQKKLGKLKSIKTQSLSIDESRKKRLKASGIWLGKVTLLAGGSVVPVGAALSGVNH